ncbi:MAG: OsmC family protein [Rhizomicrobium sp.]
MSGAADKDGEAILVEETGAGRFQVKVTAHSASFLVDEPTEAGGLGTGPNPYDLLSAALGACSAMTVRLYAEQKKYPLAHVRVKVTHHRAALAARDVFTREISFEGALDAAQTARLLAVAERCPVYLTLTRGADVQTTIVQVPPGADPATKCEHRAGMDEACRE